MYSRLTMISIHMRTWFELVREVLHALADDMEDNESYAVNGIARFRDAANSIPEDEEYFN